MISVPCRERWSVAAALLCTGLGLLCALFLATTAPAFAQRGMAQVDALIAANQGKTGVYVLDDPLEALLAHAWLVEQVKRPARVRVSAQDADGNRFEKDCEGLLAVCIQHEMDHLTGKMFVEYLSWLKQERIKTKLKKRKSREAA